MVHTRQNQRRSTILFQVPPVGKAILKKSKQPKQNSMGGSNMEVIMNGINTINQNISSMKTQQDSLQSQINVLNASKMFTAADSVMDDDDDNSVPEVLEVDPEQVESNWTTTAINQPRSANQFPQAAAVASTPNFYRNDFHPRGGGRGRGGRGGGRSNFNPNPNGRGRGHFQGQVRGRQQHHSQHDYQHHLQQRQESVPNQSQSGWVSSMSQNQRKEIQRMIDNSHIYHKKQDAKASREVILDQVPSKQLDKYDIEMERVMERLSVMMKDFNRAYIKRVQRFLTADKEGFFPVKVIFWDPAVVTALVDTSVANPGKFPFFRQSKTRMVRISNARELKKIETLNARLPENSPLVWESEDLGGLITSEQVPNKLVPLKPITAPETPGVNQRPVYAYHPKYMYKAPQLPNPLLSVQQPMAGGPPPPPPK